MALNLGIPAVPPSLSPRITVIGVGGAGSNAVNNMIRSKLQGVDFMIANTDAQALAQAETDNRIQLGVTTTSGLGAGSRPEVGRVSAEESLNEIIERIRGTNMLFITAGMGGGTGTGAAPVIAQAAREEGILTVGVVTKPFHFEGAHRMRLAEEGLQELEKVVDTLIVIPNQNLFRVANEKTTFAEAFKMADAVLSSGVRGVTDLMVMPGLINLDFADIRSVMSSMGKAMMGMGEADGDKRALRAAEMAITNPLLEEASMRGARGLLINITGSQDLTLYEVDEAANRIRQEVDAEANIIFGSIFDETLSGKIRISVVATGITPSSVKMRVHSNPIEAQLYPTTQPKKAAAPVAAPSNDIFENQEEPANYGEELMDATPEALISEAPAQKKNSKSGSSKDGAKTSSLKSPGLFERMASGLARGGTPKPNPAEPTLFDPRPEWTDETSEEEKAEQEDYLDIPAFLRRGQQKPE